MIIEMKKIFCFVGFIAILCFNSTSVFGQYDYRKGYIVTNSGDTINGYIEYGNARSNTYACYFKTDSLAEPKKYGPEELKNVHIGDLRHYVSKNVQINETTQKMFLQYLVEGSLNLYFLITEQDERYYFIEKEGVMAELSNEEVFVKKDGKTYRGKSKRYIGVLSYMVQESPTALSKVERTSFDHNSFIQITKDYHQDVCDSVECIIYSREQKRLNDAKWQFKVGVSFNHSFSKNEISNYINYLGPNVFYKQEFYTSELISSNLAEKFGKNGIVINNSYSYPGFYFNISPNWRTSFQVEIKYKKSQLVTNQFTIENKSISIPLIIKREFLYYKKLSPFIVLGCVYDYHFNSILSELNVEYTYPVFVDNAIDMTSETILLNNYHHQLNNHSIGLVFGCGLDFDINEKHGLQINVRRVLTNYSSTIQDLGEYIQFSTDFVEKSTEFMFGYNYSF